MCAMEKHVCRHLRPLEDDLASRGIAVAGAGQPWSQNCRWWLQYSVVFDCEALIRRLKLDSCVEVHVNDDPRSGREQGLVCSRHHDGIIGRHPLDAPGFTPVT